MSQAARDENHVPSALGVSSTDSTTTLPFLVDPITGRLMTDAGGGSGDVVGPGSATDNAVVRFDGATGKLVQNSVVLIGDTGAMTGLISAAFNGATSGTTTVVPTAIAGTTTLTLPAATDTLVGKATTDTFTNKTFDTAGTGNSFSIAGVAVTANSGTGAVARASSPVFVTPTLGTPVSGTLTNCTGYTVANLSGAGTGVLTALAVNVGSAGAFVTFNGALGTPSSGTLTNATGLPIAGLVSSTSTALGVGTLELGAASDTTLSRSAAGVLAVEGVVIPSISSTNTLTNKRVTRRLTTTNAPGATPTTNTDNVDIMNFTGLATAITSMTTNLSGTPSDGDLIEFRFLDDGTARGITWGATFASTTITLPTTTVISTCLRVLLEWRAASSKWECIATA